MGRDRVRHGDIVLLEAENDHPTAHAIAVLDGSQWDGVSYSHAGIVGMDLSSGEPMLISARLWKGVIPEWLVDLNADRGLLLLRHMGGRNVVQELLLALPPDSKFALGQLLMSAIVAPIRQRRSRGWVSRYAWDKLHQKSRQHTEPDACCCWPEPRRRVAPKWYCASFVDHAFRAAGSCLGIREPCPGFERSFDDRLGDHLANVLVALFLDYEEAIPDALLPAWNEVRDQVAELVGVHRVEVDIWRERHAVTEREPPALPPAPDDAAEEAVDEQASDSGGGGDAPVAWAAASVRLSGRGLADALVTELNLEPSQPLAALIELAFAYLDAEFVTRPDSAFAPGPAEPMWPPFMSIAALIHRFSFPIPVARGAV